MAMVARVGKASTANGVIVADPQGQELLGRALSRVSDHLPSDLLVGAKGSLKIQHHFRPRPCVATANAALKAPESMLHSVVIGRRNDERTSICSR